VRLLGDLLDGFDALLDRGRLSGLILLGSILSGSVGHGNLAAAYHSIGLAGDFHPQDRGTHRGEDRRVE
jgi:hypothetical protein